VDNQDDHLWRTAFPILTDAQLALMRPFGEERETATGDVLFEVGDLDYSMVVILEGRTRIVDRAAEERVLKESGPGEFHAELGILTGQTVFVACVVHEAGRVILVPSGRVREAIRTVPALADVLVPAFAARREVLMTSAAATLTLVGPPDSSAGLSLREFVDRNRIPHRWLAPDDLDVPTVLAASSGSGAIVRAVIRGTTVLEDPTSLDLARALGLDLAVQQDGVADLLVVGTGPAGLAAAVYGASEGLTTVAVDDIAIGGQAGTSSRIENYLGFPTGISGGELAFRAEVQAIKFGARITVPRRVESLEPEPDGYTVRLDDGSQLRGRSVVIATGARYRRLGLAEEDRYEGAGIYYAATDLEARLCQNQPVVVVGGGNSAGQAAMFLANTAACVFLLYRGDVLGASMSDYLTSRLEASPSVEIRTGTQIRELRGEGRLTSIVTESRADGMREIETRAIFVMIGADPCTDWFRGTVDLDAKGFVVTGQSPAAGEPARSLFETNLPGVFAVGDVRSGSVKRVASAVGEGSVVVQAVHSYLGTATIAATAVAIAPVGQ